MFPSIFAAFHNFFFDKTYFESLWDKWVAKVRGLMLGAGLAMVTYGDQLASAVPQYASKIKIGGLALSGLSVMLRAGDKTPENVKALAAEVKP